MKTLKVEFVEFIPELLSEGVLYISMKYKTARHKCPCGCGNIVIMPITPTDWQLKYNGKGVTFSPSIGNWNFDCRSHYWIIGNEIRWSGRWDQPQIDNNRQADKEKKEHYFDKNKRKDKHQLWCQLVAYFNRFLDIASQARRG